jgi:hypothetical protein
MNAFYVVPGPRAGLVIPIPVQTAYLRDLAQRENITFHLPHCEAYGYRDSPVFWSLVGDPKIKLIVLTTLRYLPNLPDGKTRSNKSFRLGLCVFGGLERARMSLEEALIAREVTAWRRGKV